MKTMARIIRKALIITSVLGISVLICSLCSYVSLLTLLAPSSEYPNYTHFPTSDALKSFVEDELSYGATVEDVRGFIEKNGMTTCFDFEEKADYVSGQAASAREVVWIICRVSAPPDLDDYEGGLIGQLVLRIFIEYFYDIRFKFRASLLHDISVQQATLSL
jgi:hypothetical protein